MRIRIFGLAAALLATASLSVPADGAPKRKPAASAAAKKKTTGAAARAAAARAAAEAAEQARLKPAWGMLAELADRDFEVNGMPQLFRWEQPMRSLKATLWTAKGPETFHFTVHPTTLKLSGRGAVAGGGQVKLGALTGLVGGRQAPTEAAERQLDFFLAPSGEIMWSELGKPERFMWREKDGSIRQRWSKASTRKIEPLQPSGKAGVALAQLVASGAVPKLPQAGASAGAQLYTLAEGLNFFRSLAGSWSNGTMVLTFRSVGASVVSEHVHPGGGTGSSIISAQDGKLLLGSEALAFVPGGFLLPTSRYGYFPKTDGSFEVRLARLKGGAMSAEKDRGFLIDGQWSRISDAQAMAFRRQAEETRLANIQAEQQRQASNSGGGGMFGKMLGGALMGAMLGGGGSNSLEMAVIGATKAAEGGNTLDQLNAMNGVMQTKVEESRRQLDATIARAEAQAAAKREAERVAAAEAAAENQRRIAEANERQQRIAEENASRQAASSAAAARQAADLKAAREQRAAEAARKAEADRLAAAAEKERLERQALADAEAAKRRQAEAARLAEVERKRAEAARPVEFKEGMVLCQQRQNSQEWRCLGPLQVTYTKMDQPYTLNEIGMACGSRTGIRDVGMVASYRVFGCGFGIHPTMRDYPGNNDVPAQLGVFVDNRRIFYCPRSKEAYCRG